MIADHETALGRLLDHLKTPKPAMDCFAPLFKRPIGPDTFGMALSESVAHLNCLLQRGLVSREISEGVAWLWRAN
jgi:hypothetical protein